jgi:hypothetical protein
MKHGVYTGVKLSDYGKGRSFNFYQARRIVNGLDHAQEIANNAREYLPILKGR